MIMDCKRDKINVKQAEIKKNERIKVISEILKALLQRKYENVLEIVRKAEGAFQQNEESFLLLRASTLILRSFILHYLTQTFETIPLTDLVKYLNLG